MRKKIFLLIERNTFKNLFAFLIEFLLEKKIPSESLTRNTTLKHKSK